MAELTTASGTRFPLKGASDADIGTNALVTYRLGLNNLFALDSGSDGDESKSVVLVLKVPLDREKSPVHHLVLTATDGGEPKLTGTVQLVIHVLDVNDNPPVFNQSLYRIKMSENTASGTLVINLNGVSAEAGVKSDLMIFSPNVPVFANSGELINGTELPPDSAKEGLLQLVLLHTAWKMGSGQLHYSVLEESQHGTFVGHIAQDLGLEVSDLVPRMFRMLSKGGKDYFEVNVQNGILFVNSWIDREELCAKNADCVVHLEVIVEKPLRFFHVEVEIKDSNDNAPTFSAREQILSISELVTSSTRFPLEGASDADIGTNALLTYKLSPNNHFVLDSGSDEDEMLDVNDNPPVFNQSLFKIKLLENTASGTLVINLNATDLDEGINREITYFFSNSLPLHVTKLFSINFDTGEIRVIGKLDYEDINFYELQIVAEDKGSSPLSGHCKVLIEVLDMNDNIPEVSLNSLSVPLPEDSAPGTVVAIISASDKDSGTNGQVNCFLWPTGLPFKLESTFKNYYSLTVGEPLDREQVAEYKMVVTLKLLEFQVRAKDAGLPSLCGNATVQVFVMDENDNAPAVSGSLEENLILVVVPVIPGHIVGKIHALDADSGYNAWLRYELVEESSGPWVVGQYSGEIMGNLSMGQNCPQIQLKR
ncbi:protocadherin alpha-11-like [Python bivittatus]|uniref:Protocadherin alpha-11-like n=1 Tax=Python bivittatus TaxID=176946 RepID=A0A9F5N2G7_PYTBI|nr:protocadherin alpha-11-like [Python bivittatus]